LQKFQKLRNIPEFFAKIGKVEEFFKVWCGVSGV
jgi:hypothetical protein